MCSRLSAASRDALDDQYRSDNGGREQKTFEIKRLVVHRQLKYHDHEALLQHYLSDEHAADRKRRVEREKGGVLADKRDRRGRGRISDFLASKKR